MFHRETDAAKVARNREAIFDLHASALEWLERYTGIPYPFGKFDFLLVPSFQFGGMEHAGRDLLQRLGLLLDESATQNQKLGRASVIAHETAHMWFGDLVTMRWFNDVWMKEVFANFMAAKIVNPSFPGDQPRAAVPARALPGRVRRRSHPGHQRRSASRSTTSNEAGTLYGAIIYQKAPIVMRQLEMIARRDGFRDGLREYLTRARVRQRDVARSDPRARCAHARGPRGVEPRLGRGSAAGPIITTELRVENGRIASAGVRPARSRRAARAGLDRAAAGRARL